MTAPLRFGIAGLGTAQAVILPQMAAHPHIKVTAATDIRPEALDRFASKFGWETYLSVEGLCRSRDVDIVRTIGGGLVRRLDQRRPSHLQRRRLGSRHPGGLPRHPRLQPPGP